MPSLSDNLDGKWPARRMGWLIVTVAVLAGLPSLRGGFLGGDDIQLVRDHVLVNRPSPEHVVKLFSIVHRDLYQPVALLSFSADFWVKELLGYPPQRGQHPDGVWIFHLNNVLIHALTAWLVFALVRRLGASEGVALVAAILFAIHPLGAETVAWLNGRMMLLSTMFLLASVVLFDRWNHEQQWWALGLSLVCVALCMMSKVRVSLPLLMLAPMVARTHWPRRRVWLAWTVAVIITAVFAWINVRASSGMIESGAEHLGENRFSRTFAALGWYLSRVIAPWGLSPNHPARPDLTWTEAQTIVGVCVSLILGGVWIVWMRARRASANKLVLVGGAWFLTSIAVTLPLVPSRNILVAQRYTYLPNIGLYLLIAVAVVAAYRRMIDHNRTEGRPRPMVINVFAAVLAAALLVGFWRTSDQYRNDVNRAERFAAVYPDEHGVLVQTGWAYYGDERFADAEAAAQAELVRDPNANSTDAHQLIGMARFKRGDLEGARRALERAVQADPDSGIAHARLANVLAKLNQGPQAVAAYERAIELAPSYNPGRQQFAELLIELGDLDAAARQYHAILANNPYDPVAINLGNLLIKLDRLDESQGVLESYLSVAPKNRTARANLAVVRSAIYLRRHSPRDAINALEPVAAGGQLAEDLVYTALTMLLERHAAAAPNDPWTYYLLARAAVARNDAQVVELAASEFKKRTSDPAHLVMIDRLVSGRSR